MIFNLNTDIEKRIINFCNIVSERRSKLLQSRNQKDPQKAYSDRYIGVLGELCVNDHLQAGQEDFILDHSDQGFRADIIHGDKLISVKTQSPESIKLWGANRFTFQDSDRKHIKAGAYNMLACVQINKVNWNNVDYSISYYGPILPVMKKRYFVDAKQSLKHNNKHILDLNVFLSENSDLL